MQNYCVLTETIIPANLLISFIKILTRFPRAKISRKSAKWAETKIRSEKRLKTSQLSTMRWRARPDWNWQRKNWDERRTTPETLATCSDVMTLDSTYVPKNLHPLSVVASASDRERARPQLLINNRSNEGWTPVRMEARYKHPALSRTWEKMWFSTYKRVKRPSPQFSSNPWRNGGREKGTSHDAINYATQALCPSIVSKRLENNERRKSRKRGE